MTDMKSPVGEPGPARPGYSEDEFNDVLNRGLRAVEVALLPDPEADKPPLGFILIAVTANSDEAVKIGRAKAGMTSNGMSREQASGVLREMLSQVDAHINPVEGESHALSVAANFFAKGLLDLNRAGIPSSELAVTLLALAHAELVKAHGFKGALQVNSDMHKAFFAAWEGRERPNGDAREGKFDA